MRKASAINAIMYEKAAKLNAILVVRCYLGCYSTYDKYIYLMHTNTIKAESTNLPSKFVNEH